MEHVTIIGSGPAGFTAALYAARANLAPLMLEGFQSGGIPGGQLMTTTEVENYPGFPGGGIGGPALMEKFREQAEEFGTTCHQEDVTEVDFSGRPFKVRTDEREVETHSVIVATGATAKRLHVPSEDRLWNRGMSACAVCDGALPVFRNKELAVIGGGDSAIEEATFAGVPVNVTLLFSREHYLAAAEAQLRGIERRIAAGLAPEVASVASVFISRWDVAVASKVPAPLVNTLGIAVARRTYKAYLEFIASPRYRRALNEGARPQRLLERQLLHTAHGIAVNDVVELDVR